MKISISFPPLESDKGVPLLTQNRQFQWFNSPTYIYPMIPAYAASLLKHNGYEVFWDDGIAEELSYQEWKDRIIREKPDIIALETKTPVVKRHWKIINDLKQQAVENNWKLKIVLMGDHATALPRESMEKCHVDFVIQGGDYDFILLNIANYLSSKEDLKSGVWFRQNGAVKCSGVYSPHNNPLKELPMIDRQLTKWKLYAYKNGNFKYTPGSYMMSARDCWWGKCTFCVTGDSQIFTTKGSKPIKEIKKGDRVLTHLGNYKRVDKILSRKHKGKIIDIKVNCLIPFKITPNHKVLCLPKEKTKRCAGAGNWAYICKNSPFSKRLKCADCDSKFYLNYTPKYVEADKIKKGDFLAIPINREIKDIDFLDLKKVLDLDPTIVKTTKKISNKKISLILQLHKEGKSERSISSILNLDRETVHRYIILEAKGWVNNKINSLKIKGNKIKFEGGKNWITSKVKLDKCLFRLFGYYLAEGHVSKLKSRPNSLVLGFTFNKKEKNYINDVRKIIKDIFKVESNVIYNEKNNTCQITVCSSLLAKLFKNLFGKDCYTKNLPKFILKANRDRQVELLRGLFRGDGHLRYRSKGGGSEYILSTVSDVLASQIGMVLLRCSALPSIRKSKKRGKMTKAQNIITLSSIDIITLFGDKKLSVFNKIKYKRGFIVSGYAFLPVDNIKKEKYSGQVYNLSVEKDHSYTVMFVAVSNCSWTSMFPGKDWRTRTAKQALDEVGNLIKLGVKEIMEDSGSLPIGEWLKEFCQGMIDRGYNKKVVMSCNMRINGIKDIEIWKLMKKAGFRFILFGLESANQKTLDKINKNLKVEEIEPGLKMCKQAGLEPHITAMIGYPWESKEDAQRTVDKAKDLFKKGYVDTLQATIVIPYPGTPLYKECLENNLLNFTDYDRFDQREQVMKSDLTTEDVKELTQGLYKSFITPKFILRKILHIRSWSDVKFFWRAGWKVLGHLMDFKK